MLSIPKALIEQLQSMALEARPLEIVGLLGGPILTSINTIIPLENAALEPTRRFQAEPGSLARGLKMLRESRLELCALFHSHPDGPATPSRTDLEHNRWDAPMLIIDAAQRTIRAWNLETNTEVKLEIRE